MNLRAILRRSMGWPTRETGFVLAGVRGSQGKWPGLEPRMLVEWILADGLPVRLGLQLHKFIWDPTTKGVWEARKTKREDNAETQRAQRFRRERSGIQQLRECMKDLMTIHEKRSCFERGDGLVRSTAIRASATARQALPCCMRATASDRSANGARSMTLQISTECGNGLSCNSITFVRLAAPPPPTRAFPFRKMDWCARPAGQRDSRNVRPFPECAFSFRGR